MTNKGNLGYLSNVVPILTKVTFRRATRPTTFRGKLYKKGQFLPKAARRGSRESYTQRRTATGRIIAALEVVTEKTVTKTVTADMMKASGGMIEDALAMTNALSRKTLQGAKFIEIRIKAKDFRNKIHRFAIQIPIEKSTDLNSLLIGRIVEKLHEQRFRPEYPTKQVDWTITKTSKTYSDKMKQLHDMQIIVKVRK